MWLHFLSGYEGTGWDFISRILSNDHFLTFNTIFMLYMWFLVVKILMHQTIFEISPYSAHQTGFQVPSRTLPHLRLHFPELATLTALHLLISCHMFISCWSSRTDKGVPISPPPPIGNAFRKRIDRLIEAPLYFLILQFFMSQITGGQWGIKWYLFPNSPSSAIQSM